MVGFNQKRREKFYHQIVVCIFLQAEFVDMIIIGEMTHGTVVTVSINREEERKELVSVTMEMKMTTLMMVMVILMLLGDIDNNVV